MEITQLENFLSVVQLGSFQQAAERKFISQRTISKQMTNLENELGVKLFYRGSNQIRLTQAGVYFAQRANDLLNQLNDSVEKLHDITDQNLQTLRMGYFSPFEGRLLANQVTDYRQNRQNLPIRFQISEASIEHLIADVTLGILDCAYVLDYGTHEHLAGTGLSSFVIHQGKMVVGLSLKHPLAAKKILTSQDLVGQRILYYSNESSTYLQSAFLATLPSNQHFNVQRIGTFEQMQMLVSLGQAIAFYPESLTMFANDQITFRPLEIPDNPASQNYTIRLIYRASNNINGLNAYRHFLQQILNVKKH